MTAAVEHWTAQLRQELGKAVVGQREALDQLLLTLLCGGHALVEGVPGVAKTLAVKVLARLCRAEFQRVQCTPDLMPADVIGTNVFNPASAQFALHRGPVFTDLLLVDEINRTPPRTQSALLEAMEERQVTIDGTRHALPTLFTVFATQNPIEFEGTYPLPEAQLDRFLLKIRVGYPDAQQEAEVLERYHRGFDPHRLEALDLVPVEAGALDRARAETAEVRVDGSLFGYIAAIARRTRDWPALTLGASPRAAVSLLLAAKATAAMDGRDYAVPDDVKAVAPPVLRHRLIVKPEAELEGTTADDALAGILAVVEVPK
ncbi:MAG TPA: MoxR family ATPase [Candidatus Polarisedimenticolaceae bacterium]|nr:MoxR family ATPase [Candidatus Polarisedimenticolaceae bacterium]